jgi:hypothetical protein
VAAEPATGIITDEELTRASGTENAEAAVAGRFLAAESAQAIPGPRHADSAARVLEWYGDSAYGSGDLRDAIARAGHVAVLKPRPAAGRRCGRVHRR